MFSTLANRQEGLRRRYAEPHRRYHNQAHVDTMLRGLRSAGDDVSHPDIVELAIWYHDAIYDPAAADNEARSAALLRAEMTGLAAEALVEGAAHLVEATSRHLVPPGMDDALLRDAEIFLDLDLAVLGAGQEEYDAYEAGIAAEYVPVHGPDAFRQGRSAFLQSMLAQDRLFLTQRFQAAFDGSARTNLHRAVRSLV